MQILIVEDDKFKFGLIESEILAVCPEAKFQWAKSVQQGVQLLSQSALDFIVLDIALPSHPVRRGGGQPISQPSGGLEILLELSHTGRFDKVLILTQYPEIEFDGKLLSLVEAKSVFERMLNVNIRDAVHFDADNQSWKERLRRALID